MEFTYKLEHRIQVSSTHDL